MSLCFNKEVGVSIPSSPPFYPSLLPQFPTDALNPSSPPGPVPGAWDRWESWLTPGLPQRPVDSVSMRLGDGAVTEMPRNSCLQMTKQQSRPGLFFSPLFFNQVTCSGDTSEPITGDSHF